MSQKDLLASPEELFHWGIKGLLRNSAGEVLLLETSPDRGKFWDLPGGRVQRGKSALETLGRELEEETGLVKFINRGCLATFPVQGRIPFDQRDVGLILSVYLLDVDGDLSISLSHEHDQFAWLSLAEAARRLTAKFPTEFTQTVRCLPVR